jgi:hypothetical protein
MQTEAGDNDDDNDGDDDDDGDDAGDGDDDEDEDGDDDGGGNDEGDGDGELGSNSLTSVVGDLFVRLSTCFSFTTLTLVHLRRQYLSVAQNFRIP